MNDDPSELESRRLGHLLHLVGLAVLLMLLGVYYGTFCRHLHQEAELADLEATRLENQVFSRSVVHREYEQRVKERDELMRRAASIRERIPDSPEEAEFLRQVTEAADREGLTIRDYKVGMASATPTHSCLDVRLQCQGNYHSICGLLDHLARLPRIASVQRLRVLAPTDADDYPLEIGLWLYFGARPAAQEQPHG